MSIGGRVGKSRFGRVPATQAAGPVRRVTWKHISQDTQQHLASEPAAWTWCLGFLDGRSRAGGREDLLQAGLNRFSMRRGGVEVLFRSLGLRTKRYRMLTLRLLALFPHRLLLSRRLERLQQTDNVDRFLDRSSSSVFDMFLRHGQVNRRIRVSAGRVCPSIDLPSSCFSL